MTVGLGEAPTWSRRRWWGAVLLILVVQLIMIFWLGQRGAIQLGPASPGPQLHLVEGKRSELLALTDPTLFALPHRQGFSGLAWLKNPTQDIPAFTWSEDPSWLPMSVGPLGAAFEPFIATNTSELLEALGQAEPELRLPMLPPTRELSQQTTLRLTGALAQRRLLSSINLPSWPSAEILTNTVVQLTVDAEGKPWSAVLLYPGSGDKEADTKAYAQATKARFEPLNAVGGASNLMSGLMIFEWHTLSIRLTNSYQAPK